MPTEHLWSTTSMALLWLQTTDGFVIVFSIKQRESFDKLVDEFKFLLQLKEKNDVPLILVGSEHGYCEEPASGNTRQVTAEGMAPYLCTLIPLSFLRPSPFCGLVPMF